MRIGWENVRGGYYIHKLFGKISALINEINTVKEKALPDVTADDNGKTMVVADGEWSLGEPDTGIQNIWDSTGTGAVAGGNADSEATGNYAFAFGTGAKAYGANSHAIGAGTTASGTCSHSEGEENSSYGRGSHAEGYKTQAGISGDNTVNYSHAEGSGTKATGFASHSEGIGSTAQGANSHAEGAGSTAQGANSHSEGAGTSAQGDNSHAEGAGTISKGVSSHAEGSGASANGNYSHAEGNGASHGAYCHSEGYQTRAGSAVGTSNESCHAEGYQTEATGKGSHSEGIGTNALGEAQHAGGMYNIADYTSLETIGNGTASNHSNARTLNKSGDEWLAGQIQPEGGLRLKAPNGTYYNVTVDNNGALSITAVT